jgi:hypothetical protein
MAAQREEPSLEESNIQVVCRFRPFNEREKQLGLDGHKDVFKMGENYVKVTTLSKCVPLCVFLWFAVAPQKQLMLPSLVFVYSCIFSSSRVDGQSNQQLPRLPFPLKKFI